MVRERIIVGASLLAFICAFVGLLTAPGLVFGAPQPQSHEQQSASKYLITQFQFQSSGAVGDMLQGLAVISNAGTEGGTPTIELRINDKLINLYDIHLEPGEVSNFPIRHIFDHIGTYTISVVTPDDSKSQQVNVIPGGKDASVPTPAPTPTPTPTPTPNPGDSQISLKTFDIDSSCKLDDSEFFNVIDRWVNSTTSDTIFFVAVDAWISQSSICAAASQFVAVIFSAQSTRKSVLFSAQGEGTQGIGVQVFDLTGKLITDAESLGSRLRWSLVRSDGRQVANGVYLYRVLAYGQDHHVSSSSIQKLLVLR